MDDVLPKPFTRKSLLDMLEKHLVHLKTVPPGMEGQPGAVTMAQTSATHSVKEDSSPAPSPAGSMSNWQSPGQFSGLAPPVHPGLQQVQGQYVAAPAYTVDQNGVQYPAHPVPLAAPARPPHRRQLSEMSGAADNPNLAKRPRMYAQQPQMVNPVQATRTG